jgi:hypothetical protein
MTPITSCRIGHFCLRTQEAASGPAHMATIIVAAARIPISSPMPRLPNIAPAVIATQMPFRIPKVTNTMQRRHDQSQENAA